MSYYAMRENFRTEEAPTRCFETRTKAAGRACGLFRASGIFLMRQRSQTRPAAFSCRRRRD